MEYKINVFMYKALNTNLPENLQCLFQCNSKNKHYTRQLCNFKVKFSKSKIKSNCLSIIGVRLWNKLGDNMKTCHSLLNLKNVKINLPEKVLTLFILCGFFCDPAH